MSCVLVSSPPCDVVLLSPVCVCVCARWAGSVTMQICPLGFFCGQNNLPMPAVCPAGAFCGEFGLSAPSPCVLGSYQPFPGQIFSSACLSCPTGSFCNTSGLSSPFRCTVGKYSDLPSSTACSPSPLGSLLCHCFSIFSFFCIRILFDRSARDCDDHQRAECFRC